MPGSFPRVFDRSLLRIWGQLTVACLLLIFIAGAGDSTARYQKIGHQLMCTCGCNQVLLECNHVGCTVSTQEEAELRVDLQRGESDQLILQNFVQKYGPTVLAAPPERGFDLMAWITPGLFLVLATLVTALLIRKWKLHTVAMPQIPTDPHTQEVLSRIRRETEL